MPIRSVLLFIALSVYESEPAIVLGVLEQIPGHYVGESSHRAVRVVFQKKGREWQAFPSSCPDESCLKKIAAEYPPEVTWTISFSGRNLGQVTGAMPKQFEFYSDVGLQKITSKSPIPVIGKESAEFGVLGSPALRPLVADSQPNFKDPDSWKPSRLKPGIAASLCLAFRKKFPKVSNCTAQDDTPKQWPYSNADIKVNKSYSSSPGWSVVEIVLSGYRCEGPLDDPFVGQWFAVTPRGEIMRLGEGMFLVDAGDYDNDGKSELLFAIDRYNEGGYELFYDDFKSHAAFQFSYH